MPKFTAEEKKAILSEYRSGTKFKAICRKYNISAKRFNRWKVEAAMEEALPILEQMIEIGMLREQKEKEEQEEYEAYIKLMQKMNEEHKNQ